MLSGMQSKTMRSHCTSSRMVKIWNTDTPKCWLGCGATGIPTDRWWKCKIVQPLWKTVWLFPKILNVFLPYDTAIALLIIYPKELKTYVTIQKHTQGYV